jgi:spore germination cell wall hydrolase CwlJ-like protein
MEELYGANFTPAQASSSTPAASSAVQDIDLLARVTYAEAAGQYNVPDAMEGVAWVVRNRVADPRFPNSYQGAIFQRNQFVSVGGRLWTQAGNPAALRGTSLTAYNRALSVAQGVYAGAIADPTRGALYFHSGGPTPWFQGAIVAGRIQSTLIVPPPPQPPVFTFYR